MIITTGSYTIDDEGADLFDAGKFRYRAHDEKDEVEKQDNVLNQKIYRE